jgi:Na+/phosphate symporter
MNDKPANKHPFSEVCGEVEVSALRLEDLYKRPVSDAVSPAEGILIMTSKIIEMTRVLSRCLSDAREPEMEVCRTLAAEIHQHEKVLTARLVSAEVSADTLRNIIRFPSRLERIGDMLESVLNCCRIKERDSVRFDQRAYHDLDAVFEMLLGILYTMRDALVTPETAILTHIASRTSELDRTLHDFRADHWERLAAGICPPGYSSLYLDIFDSIRSVNEYVGKMSLTLAGMVTGSANYAGTGTGEASEPRV